MFLRRLIKNCDGGAEHPLAPVEFLLVCLLWLVFVWLSVYLSVLAILSGLLAGYETVATSMSAADILDLWRWVVISFSYMLTSVGLAYGFWMGRVWRHMLCVGSQCEMARTREGQSRWEKISRSSLFCFAAVILLCFASFTTSDAFFDTLNKHREPRYALQGHALSCIERTTRTMPSAFLEVVEDGLKTKRTDDLYALIESLEPYCPNEFREARALFAATEAN